MCEIPLSFQEKISKMSMEEKDQLIWVFWSEIFALHQIRLKELECKFVKKVS
jgi:hypothetical protein